MRKIKKEIKLFLVLALLCLVHPTDAYASNYKYSASRVNECVNDGSCILMCGYTNEIATHENVSKDNWIVYSSYIYYSQKDKDFFIESHRSDKARNTYTWDSKYVFKSSYATSKLQKGECPKNSYIDNDGLASEICFDDNSGENGYCKSNDPGDLGTTFTGKSILEYNYMDDINTWVDKWSYGDVECLDLVGLTKDEFKNKIEKKFTQDWLNYTHNHNLPDFLDDIVLKKMDTIYANDYQNFYNRCSKELEEAANTGQITQEEKNETLENIELTEEEQTQINENGIANINQGSANSGETEQGYTGELYCNIFGENTWKYVKSLYKIIKICIPFLIIILGMLDFMKVLLSGEQKDMKLAGQRFMKRIIAGVVLLLIPVLLKFLFNVIGFSENCLQQLFRISLK